MNRVLATCFVLATGWLVGATAVQAQGVTTAAVSGRVVDREGSPLAGVMVRATNQATGIARTAVTDAQGQYYVSGLQVGGPYTVAVSQIGYAPDQEGGLNLALGQNLVLDFVLAVEAVELAGIRVTEAAAAGLIRPGRTGAEQLVTEQQLSNLPTISRNFTDFIGMSPLVGGGGAVTSVAQGHNRFNTIQIDGALSQDLFGLGSTGQPGGQAGARSISIEAVKQYQILAAPFDVRQSGFAGGLINAVTKSGTNELHGGVYFYYKNEDFARRWLDVRGTPVEFGEFRNPLYGGFVGGPLIRDRAHYFISAEIEDQRRPGGNVAIGRDPESLTTVFEADAQRFSDLLAGYGVEPGGFGVRERSNPNRNFFGRIDAQLSPAHSLTLRHNHVRAEDDVVQNRFGGNYSFDSNWYFFESTTNSSVAQLNSVLGNRFYNELRLGATIIRDRRSPFQRFPVISVSVPRAPDAAGTRNLLAGAEFFSQGNELDQDSYEIANDLSFSRGDHRFTVGVKNELFKFRNLFWPGMTGEWTFASLDDFAAGNANSFRRNVAATSDVDPNASFRVNQMSIYGQTEWSGIDNVVITAGLRYDHPMVLDDPIHNPAIEAAFGRRTDQVPSGNGILSPRLGFNWDVYGDRSTQVRGGAGIFTGRHPFVWLSNVYSNTGLFTVTVNCSAGAGNMPAFTIDPDNQPSACAVGGAPAPPTAVINLVDPDFQYPHNYRLNLALDRELPYGIVGTAEVMYTRARKTIFLRELNVDFANPVSVTQGGREVYGTHTAGPLAPGANNVNLAQPNRFSDAALAVVELTNSDQDRSYSMTLQAQRRSATGPDLNASYTFGRAKDISGLTSSIATSNIGFNPVAGSPNSPDLVTSDFEMQHKTVFSVMYDVRPWANVALFYTGSTGRKYSYVYDGDVNADGYEAAYAGNRFNDLMYVPLNEGDITLTDPADWADLNAYISTEPCLENNRGRIIARNACDAPWHNRMDARLTFRVPTLRTQTVELTADVFNVLNLLSKSWGRNEGVTFPIDLLELRGWDEANNRGIFRPKNVQLDPDTGRADPNTVFDPSSRWQAQIGVRYAF